MIRATTIWILAASLLAAPVAAAPFGPPVPAPAPPDSAAAPVPLALSGVEPTDRSLQFFAGGAGLLGGLALAVILKGEADDRYSTYLATADPDAARGYYDDAQRYDRLSLIGWGLAEASLVYLFYLFTREEERSLIPTEGQPLVRVSHDGVELGMKVRP